MDQVNHLLQAQIDVELDNILRKWRGLHVVAKW